MIKMQCIIGELDRLKQETSEGLPWLRGTWIPEREYSSLTREIHKAEVMEYVFELFKPFLGSVNIGNMVCEMVKRDIGIDFTPVSNILEKAGFKLEYLIGTDEKNFMPRQSDSIPVSGYNEVFSYGDGLKFVYSKKALNGAEVKYLIEYYPKRRKPGINVEIIDKDPANLAAKIAERHDYNNEKAKAIKYEIFSGGGYLEYGWSQEDLINLAKNAVSASKGKIEPIKEKTRMQWRLIY